MARTPTTSDAFNAVAEPQRRRIIDLLAHGEQSVNDIAAALQMRQPQVSKHLRVLREVGLVRARGEGRQQFYTLNSEALRPIYEWVSPYEQTWRERFERLDELLDELQTQPNEDGLGA
ncbi:MAG: winged helix-turn-helix transcriptional regulator [Anaerolineae bacterium]|uniref:ArsR/SmtB family transcription factor n=1 Tax=Promineifilum sp. TaxID=2664178 RepID=UPI001D57DF03|nr:winged helix-turn-helix transcriptional regulator [Anaerolineales bacterium]MCB8934471.1 winged helix-turn-helix transcriptional regulator [Promineifilum sp.]MCO5179959.1 metalloregulator ArsR/SmtB family transcription factor [Promineifilum sp.]MCW5847119.1 winged helix-turn-helix transcriptional regulator [Anaerolineae bacterium]